jgi:hypothetical protein
MVGGNYFRQSRVAKPNEKVLPKILNLYQPIACNTIIHLWIKREKTHETGKRITTFIESFTSKVPSNEMGKQNYAIT